MDNPEQILEQLRSEKAELIERKRGMFASIRNVSRLDLREALDQVNDVYLKHLSDINEQIYWNQCRITHPTALPMFICDLAQVRAERVQILVEAIFGEKYSNPSAEVLMTLREICKEVLRGLSPREQTVLVTCFALDGGPKMTLREVGEKYGLSGPRIAQMRDKALRKMRHPLRVYVDARLRQYRSDNEEIE